MRQFLSLNIRGEEFSFLRGFRRKGCVVVKELKTYPIDRINMISSKKEDVYINYAGSFSYFDVQNVPRTSKRVLPFYLRKKIDEMGIMKEREDFFINYKIVEETEGFLKLAYFAAPQEEKEKILHALQSNFQMLKLFTLEVCAVACLISRLTKEANVAILKSGERIFFIFNKCGVIYHIHTIRANMAEVEAESAIRYFKETFHKELKFCFLIGEEVQGEYNISVPVCSPFFGNLIKGISNRDANNFASALGNLFVTDEENLLPEQYMSLVKNLRLSKGIGVFFFIFSFAFLVLAVYNLSIIRNLKKDYEIKYTAVEKGIDYINRLKPSEEEIRKLNTFINFYEVFLNEPKVTTVTVWLCKNVPHNIRFTNTDMKMENGNLNISIKGIALGNYERARQSFTLLLDKMRTRFILQDKVFNYIDNKGVFSIKCIRKRL